MKLTQIKVDHWYRTNVGDGICERVGGTHPPFVRVRVFFPLPCGPLPHGVVNVTPRDVECELQACCAEFATGSGQHNGCHNDEGTGEPIFTEVQS